MNPFKYQPSCFLMLALLTWVSPGAQAQVTKHLRWNVTKGQRFQVDMSQTTKQTINRSDQELGTTNDMQLKMTWNVEDTTPEGTIIIGQRIDRVIASFTLPNIGNVKYDSSSEDQPEGFTKMFADMVKPMVGVTITQEMNSLGEISDVRIPEEALKGMQANPMMAPFFSAEAFTKMVQQSAPVLPMQAIAVGHKWNRQSAGKSPVGEMKLNQDYTYEGETQRHGKTVDHIRLDFTVDFVASEGGPKITVVQQQNDGAIFFDNDEGRLDGSELRQNITLQLEILGQTLNQRIENTVKLSVTPMADGSLHE